MCGGEVQGHRSSADRQRARATARSTVATPRQEQKALRAHVRRYMCNAPRAPLAAGGGGGGAWAFQTGGRGKPQLRGRISIIKPAEQDGKHYVFGSCAMRLLISRLSLWCALRTCRNISKKYGGEGVVSVCAASRQTCHSLREVCVREYPKTRGVLVVRLNLGGPCRGGIRLRRRWRWLSRWDSGWGS